MEDSNYGSYTNQNFSHRPLAIVLALASAMVLSPLRSFESRLSSGFVLPLLLLVLIIAIKTSSSSSCSSSSMPTDRRERDSVMLSSDRSWILQIGSSSWGLAGILVMLILGLSWQSSVQEFIWR